MDVIGKADEMRAALARGASRCAGCGRPLSHLVADLGMHPAAASVAAEDLDRPATFYSLRLYLCDRCWLVQRAPGPPEPTGPRTPVLSEARLAHAYRLAAQAVERFDLGPRSRVIEVASGDGQLLRHFVERGIPALGIEPDKRLASEAVAGGITTLQQVFDVDLADELAASGQQADLLLADDVLPHVADLGAFVTAVGRTLRTAGVAVLEFPNLLALVEGGQFDLLDVRRRFVLSLTTARSVIERHGLRVFDAEELPAFGGTVRLYLCADGDPRRTEGSVDHLVAQERERGLTSRATYAPLQGHAACARRQLLAFLLEARQQGRRVVAMDAGGRGSTLLNYCALGPDVLEYLVDEAAPVQEGSAGQYTAGVRVPVAPSSRVRETRPDYILILAREMQDELMTRLDYIREWGGRFVVAVPRLRIYS